jgi:hypothetical protein
MNTLVDKFRSGFKKVGSKTKKAIVTGAAVAAFAIPSVNGQIAFEDQTENYKHFVNPFIQPRETLDYYGSGDVDNRGTITLEDAQYIAEGEYNYRADVNGDGIVDSADKELIEKYVNGDIKYLPGHWNDLESVEERKSWIRKMIAIDKSDEKKYVADQWTCGNFALDVTYNFNWVENIENWEGYEYSHGRYDFSDLGRFNLPMYNLSCKNSQGIPHEINIIFVGHDDLTKEDVTDFDQYMKIESQNDLEQEIGGSSINGEGYAHIIGPSHYLHPIFGTDRWGTSARLVEWELENGKANLEFEHPNLVKARPDNHGTSSRGIPLDKNFSGNAYPNPVTGDGDLTIPYAGNRMDEVNMEVYDMAGKRVYEAKYYTNPGESELVIPQERISKLAKGVYSYAIRSKEGVGYGNFIRNSP